jgi:uncharacterized protein YjcR
MNTFKDVIDQWPSVDDLATDLDEKPATVRKWKQRDSIPADRWALLLVAAKNRRIRGIDEVKLVKLARRDRAA